MSVDAKIKRAKYPHVEVEYWTVKGEVLSERKIEGRQMGVEWFIERVCIALTDRYVGHGQITHAVIHKAYLSLRKVMIPVDEELLISKAEEWVTIIRKEAV